MRRAVLIVTATSLAVSAATLRLSGGTDQMRSLPLLAAGAITAALAIAPTAYADVIFTLGNHPTDEVNILFGAPETGTTITGEIDHTGTPVNFSSTADVLSQVSQGQAKIENAAGPNTVPLTELSINVPGHTFGDFIMNPLNGVGSATVTATDNFDHTFSYNLGNGQNYLTITTANNESIANLKIDMTCSATQTNCGFLQFKQPRISEVTTVCPPGSPGCGGGGGGVPEPWTLSLFGAGLIGLGVVRWRKNTA